MTRLLLSMRRGPARTTPRAVAAAVLMLVLLIPVAVGTSGCGPLTAGADPVVVSSEKSTEVAFEAINLFLTVEHDNREAVKAQLPAVHAFAEKCRVEAPPLLRDARSFTAAYKLNKRPGDQTKAEEAIGALQALARVARQHVAEISALPDAK